MTSPGGNPLNVAGEGSQVGVQAGYADIDTVILPGNVQLTVGQDASPAAKYQAGVENLKSGDPKKARELIWEAMMSGYTSSEVLFHWLVAMLSGRTVRQFSQEEVGQLKWSRSRCAESGGDAWADGVRLIYRLHDSVLRATAVATERSTAESEMSLLIKQFESLPDQQRDMVRPHLELFLDGPLKDDVWQRELKIAQSRQHSGDRLGRAWMFFQPIPAMVLIPSPRPERISAVDRTAMQASACMLAAGAAYLGWELLRHDAFLELLGYVVALAGGIVAATADLEWRFLTDRCRQKDEQFRASSQSASRSTGDALANRVDTLFNRYFDKYALDKAERERWKAAVAGFRKFHADEIIAVCRNSGIQANEVAWLIRYEVRQLKQRWENGTLYEHRQLLQRPGIAATRHTGLAVLVLGGVWAVVALWADPLAEVVVLPTVLCSWWCRRCWLRINLEHRRYAADSEEHAQRQTAIHREYGRWSAILRARPKDEDMAAWLGFDRTVFLGRALDHFRLLRSRLKAYAFHEQPGVAVKRARIEGGPWRYAGYRLEVFLLAEDGVRHVKATLASLAGTLTMRERTSYRYDAIVSVRVLRRAPGRHRFELRLAAGDLITIPVRGAEPGGTQQDQDSELADEAEQAGEAEEEATTLDVTSMADLMHMLEGVAGEGGSWLQGLESVSTWSGGDEADHGGDPL